MTVSQARKLLGKDYRKNTDQEIQLIIDQTYLLCDIATDIVINKHGSKRQLGVIDHKAKKRRQ